MSVGAIAARELRSLFVAPLGWVVLAVTQAVLALVFLKRIDLYIESQPVLGAIAGAPGLTALVVAPLLQVAAAVHIVVVPLLTMHLVAQERRDGTFSLLLSSPVSMSEIVLGKYLGVLGFFGCVVAMIALMPISLLAGGQLDVGLTLSGFLGLALVVAGFAAAGLYVSTLTRHPAVAGIAAFGLLLVLWIVGWIATADGGAPSALARYLSSADHLNSLLRGVFDTRDVVYYVLFTITFLVLSIRRLDALRLHP